MKKKLLRYFVEASGRAADQVVGFAKGLASIAGIAAEYIRALVQLALLVLVLPIPLLIVGIVFKAGWLVSAIGMFWALATLLLLLIATPLGILIEVVAGGFSGSGHRYVRLVLSTLLFELTATLFVAIVPIGNNWRAVPIVLLAAAILGILAAQGIRTIFTKRLLGGITTVILFVFIVSFAFPKSFSAFQSLVPWVDQRIASLISPEARAARRQAEEEREAMRQDMIRREAACELARADEEHAVSARRETERRATTRRESGQRVAIPQTQTRQGATNRSLSPWRQQIITALQVPVRQAPVEQLLAQQALDFMNRNQEYTEDRMNSMYQGMGKPSSQQEFALSVGEPIPTVMAGPSTLHRFTANKPFIIFSPCPGGDQWVRYSIPAGRWYWMGINPVGRLGFEGISSGTVIQVLSIPRW